MLVTKMHGARNDFVVADARRQPLADASSFARWVCDRRAGVGADGLILLERSNVADVRMRIINADGSEAEMCGNGVRCAARWLEEAGEGDRIAFETDAGLVRTEVVARDSEYLVRVSMGRPKIAPIRHMIPTATFVDIGNPHVVIFETSSEAFDLDALARNIQTDPAFPDGTNVHIAVPTDAHSMRVLHWERGVGLTQACGTGAVACAAVAIQRGNAVSPVEVL
ncbi:MAG TPA: diaminopimelate epimerase, partial [Candidatus Cybelea sp.]|nr:diaminopimelate epimerase [Candidatus Cybelea sp.]